MDKKLHDHSRHREFRCSNMLVTDSLKDEPFYAKLIETGFKLHKENCLTCRTSRACTSQFPKAPIFSQIVDDWIGDQYIALLTHNTLWYEHFNNKYCQT